MVAQTGGQSFSFSFCWRYSCLPSAFNSTTTFSITAPSVPLPDTPNPLYGSSILASALEPSEWLVLRRRKNAGTGVISNVHARDSPPRSVARVQSDTREPAVKSTSELTEGKEAKQGTQSANSKTVSDRCMPPAQLHSQSCKAS